MAINIINNIIHKMLLKATYNLTFFLKLHKTVLLSFNGASELSVPWFVT